MGEQGPGDLHDVDDVVVEIDFETHKVPLRTRFPLIMTASPVPGARPGMSSLPNILTLLPTPDAVCCRW